MRSSLLLSARTGLDALVGARCNGQVSASAQKTTGSAFDDVLHRMWSKPRHQILCDVVRSTSRYARGEALTRGGGDEWRMTKTILILSNDLKSEMIKEMCVSWWISVLPLNCCRSEFMEQVVMVACRSLIGNRMNAVYSIPIFVSAIFCASHLEVKATIHRTME